MDAQSDFSPADGNNANRKIDEARTILEVLDFPRAQLNDRSALALLALLDLKPDAQWADAENPLIGITPIMAWCKEHYGREYAPNTRETFRRQTVHQFVSAALVLSNPDNPNRPTNSPKWSYQLDTVALNLLRTFGTEQWAGKLATYKLERIGLRLRYAKEREMNLVPISIKGAEIALTPGKHSELIQSIVTEFAPRYASDGQMLYLGDTGEKWGYFDSIALAQLGVDVDKHGKMPDVVMYLPSKNWLLLIEAVTSHGPVDGKRHEELARLFHAAQAGLIFVTVFPTRSLMARYVTQISWETEVWVADAPDHLIHFDGERFLGPYATDIDVA